MTFKEMIQHTNPYLLCWIDLTMTPKHPTDISQLKRIKRLADKDFPVPHSEYTKQKLPPIQDFLHSRVGDWVMLEEMASLQVLKFPKRTPPGIIDDFSFLPKLKKLYRLALRYTSFTDCSLLSGLTQLKSLALPARKKLIQAGEINSLLLSLDENGEEDFFTMDIKDGWTAPMFNIWNEDGEAVCFQPINEKYPSVEEDAPVEIGGQSPVPKRFALDDLAVAAECAVHFAKTGKLYPAVQWAEFSRLEQISTHSPNFAFAHLSPWSAICWGVPSPSPADWRFTNYAATATTMFVRLRVTKNIISFSSAQTILFSDHTIPTSASARISP